jgi:O-antigen ligase
MGFGRSTRQGRAPSGGALTDVAIAATWVGLLVWVTVAARSPDEATPTQLAVALAGGVYLAARLLTFLAGWVVPVVVVLVGAAVAALHADVLYSGPLTSPLGYSNATAAFYVAVVGAALIVVGRSRDPSLQLGAGAAALGAFTVPVLNGAAGAAIAALALPLALCARPLGGRIRSVVVAAAVVLLGVIACTLVIGATYSGSSALDRIAASALSERRPVLWRDAIDIVAADPLRGAGTGRFSQESPTALADRDAAWAHNEFLEVAAGTGLPGGVLLVALVLLVLLRLWHGPRDAATGVAATTVAAVCVLAAIDYVFHFPAVVVAVAAVAGSGLTDQPVRERTVPASAALRLEDPPVGVERRPGDHALVERGEGALPRRLGEG